MMNEFTLNRIKEIKQSGYDLNLNSLLNQTFQIYKKIFFFAFSAIIIYFLIQQLLTEFLDNWSGIGELNRKLLEKIKGKESNQIMKIFIGYSNELSKNPKLIPYLLLTAVISVIIYPLFVGIINVCYKSDTNEGASYSDIFYAYQGNRFFKFTGLFLIYNLLKYASIIFIIPYFYLGTACLIAAPFMIFGSASIWESIKFSCTVSNVKWFTIFTFFIIIFIFSFSSALIHVMLLPATLPFLFAGIYCLYKNIIGIEEISNNVVN